MSRAPAVSRRTLILVALFLFVAYHVGRLSFNTSTVIKLTSHFHSTPPPSDSHADLDVLTPVVEAGSGAAAKAPEIVTVTHWATTTVQGSASAATGIGRVHMPYDAQRPLVKGPPTSAFQDNLRDDVQYVTTWPGAGFTNDIMTFINLIYYAMLTQRTPILTYFTPSHISNGNPGGAPAIDVSEVFDLPLLERAINFRILEWSQVKSRDSISVDPMGCWSVWQAVSPENTGPHWTVAPERLGLDISYTTAPSFIKLYEHDPYEYHMDFAKLVLLSFPLAPEEEIQEPAPSPLLLRTLPPDDHLLCFDNFYWAAHLDAHEMQHDHSNAWRLVGRYMQYTPAIRELTGMYLRDAFGVKASDPIPPYIAIHARHGDFKGWCPIQNGQECFASLEDWDREVKLLKAELLEQMGITVKHVLMTSDEDKDEWWAQVRKKGWYRLDTSKKSEKYGIWRPILVDACAQAGGIGFLGTKESTVSLLSLRRVREWNGGIARMVEWGEQPEAESGEEQHAEEAARVEEEAATVELEAKLDAPPKPKATESKPDQKAESKAEKKAETKEEAKSESKPKTESTKPDKKVDLNAESKPS